MIYRLFAFALLIIFGHLFSMYSGISGCAGTANSDGTSGDGGGATSTFPETCQDVQELAIEETGDNPANGTYTLYVGGDESQPWDAYCHNMSRAEPSEYLTVTEADNYSQVRTNDAVATTTYARLRIDPQTLTINPLDATFATNDFTAFTPTFPVDTMTSIPAGWAEALPMGFVTPFTPAEANVSLEGTSFTFSEDILVEDEATRFFCQVDSQTIEPESTTGTGSETNSSLTIFHLTAVNTNSEEFADGVYTREVADCTHMGTGATDYSTAAIPLVYTAQ